MPLPSAAPSAAAERVTEAMSAVPAAAAPTPPFETRGDAALPERKDEPARPDAEIVARIVAEIAPGAGTSASPRVAASGAAVPLAVPSSEAAVFARRGDELLAAGDVASARLFLERAARAGSARGAGDLGKTYDPIFLGQLGVRGVSGDPQKAMAWYREAARLGDAGSGAKLKRLLLNYSH